MGTEEGIEVGWIGGRAVAFAIGARYCFKDGPSGGEAGLAPVASDVFCNEGITKPVPEIGTEATWYQLNKDLKLKQRGGVCILRAYVNVILPHGAAVAQIGNRGCEGGGA